MEKDKSYFEIDAAGSLYTSFVLYNLRIKVHTITTFVELANKKANFILILCSCFLSRRTAGDWLVGFFPFCQCRFFYIMVIIFLSVLGEGA